MNDYVHHDSAGPRGRHTLHTAVGVTALTLASLGILSAKSAQAADPTIDLGTAKAFSVLAGSGVSNTGVTSLAGSVGSYETPTVSTDTPFVFTGAGAEDHAGDGVTQQAKSDLLAAYNETAGALPPTAVPQELTRNDPYLPGIYRASSSMLLSGAMTLDGNGRKDGVFVFQAPSTLITASNSTVNFVNGAQPCNVYWQVGSSATFGTGTSFVGNVLAHTSISATTNATFEGRLLASNGAVTLDSNTIVDPRCDTTPDAGTDTTAVTGTEGTSTDSGTETDPDGGTDTDTAVDTDAGTDAGGGTDTDTDAGASADSGTEIDAGTDAGAQADDGSNIDSAGTDSDSVDSSTDLPDTGGPAVIPLAFALVAMAGGVALVRARRHRGTHRA
ncbi:ice-binding family protein [Aeromicrobium sp. NPDC092404]|uniref:ice-binding family protein n=1 Tax=Aeromicrobium sp. NPDC092404 TaxID=3154976 RepID=UPI003449FEF8